MRNFQLADNLHSFCLRSSCDCCDEQCGSKKKTMPASAKGGSAFGGKPDAFEYLLRGTYIFCSCLIVYSLLLINFMSVGDPNNNNVFSVVFRPLAQAGKELTYNALYVGRQMGDPLDDTIKIYSKGMISLFQNTGEILAKVPGLLSWAPPVKARTINNNYW